MIAAIWNLILKIFGAIENPQKPTEEDIPVLPEKVPVESPPTEASGEVVTPAPPVEPSEPEPSEWKLRWDLMMEVLYRPFDGPLDALPSRRYPKEGELSVYGVYGRPSNDTGNKQFPKANLKVHENLPGNWNNDRPRLYMENRAGIYFREGLSRCEELEARTSSIMGIVYKVLSYLTKIGAYSPRHIRHNKSNPLSYHSWAFAFDQNMEMNRGVSKHHKWQRKVKINGKIKWIPCTPNIADRGPIHTILPFSKQYFEVYPDSMPLELFIAFISVGFSCGMNWGRMEWLHLVRDFGIGYDQNDQAINSTDAFKRAMGEWESIDFVDPMHYELTTRGEWAKKLWLEQQSKISAGGAL